MSDLRRDFEGRGKDWNTPLISSDVQRVPTSEKKIMTQEEIEAFFLNHNDPWYEKIQEAKTENEAEGMASDELDNWGEEYDSKDLIAVVRKIREQE